MLIHTHDIVRDYLLFPARVQAGVVTLDHPIYGPCQDAFQHELRLRYRSYRNDDLRELTRQAFEGRPGFFDWYRASLLLAGVAISFRDAAPRVAWGSFTRWRGITFSLDPDALLTVEFVHQMRRQPRECDLSNWGIHALADNPALDRIYADGISDVHTHLEGCECVPILWLELMWGRLRVDSLAEYKPSTMGRLKDVADDADNYTLWNELNAEKRAISAARKLWGKKLGPAPHTLDGDFHPHPSPLSKALWRERAALASEWLEVKTGNIDAARSLDRYLFAKNRFLARHQQFPGSNPGLENFRKHYNRVKPPKKQSTKLKNERLLRLIGSATESPHLHSIEFRIKPEIHMGAYARFFSDWETRFKRSTYLNGKQGFVSFVVHFIRWTDGDPPDGDGEFPHEVLRRELDLQSAALHIFRVRHSDGLARHISGIDVANKERLCPVDVFSPYLRLLRGFPDDNDQHGSLTSRYLSHWDNIRRKGMILLPALPRLGLTYHAGEDFFHPLDGIRAIWDAITHCKMLPGDRIGHGLAAGTNVAAFDGRTALIPQGEVIDSLAWLHQISDQMDEGRGTRQSLESYLIQKSGEIYGEIVPPAHLCLVKELRHRLPDVVQSGNLPDQVRRVLRQEWTIGCRRKRAALVPLPSIYECIQAAIAQAQRTLVKEIARKEVIFEINPSSNLATSDFSDLTDHPYFAIRENAKGQGKTVRITINCDDPGTFATRLESEYALMAEAMERTFGRNSSESPIAMIKEMIHWGREATFRS